MRGRFQEGLRIANGATSATAFTQHKEVREEVTNNGDWQNVPTRTKYGTNGAAPSSRPPITDYIKNNGQGTMSMAKVLFSALRIT
jgi:hypothetical protein